MSKAGKRILEGLQDAIDGNFASVIIKGTRWAPEPSIRSAVEQEIAAYLRSEARGYTRTGEARAAILISADAIVSGSYRKERG